MRILQVIHGFLPQFRGGTELYLLGLARELRSQGHEVQILTGTTDSAPKSKVENFEYEGFKVHKLVQAGSYLEHWTRSFAPEATRLYAETLARVQPDLVHIQHWYRLSRNLIETCHRMDIPTVCTLHDLWTTCPRIFRIRDESYCDRPLSGESCQNCVPRFPWMDDELTASEVDLFQADFANELNLARRVIVPTVAHGEAVASSMDLDRSKFYVLSHGTITKKVDPPKKAKSRRGRIHLGVWGHLFHMKGVHLVLEALQELRDKDLFVLHVWGKVVEPKYKARLEQLAKGLNIEWYGEFVPDDLSKVSLDLAVIPSLCSESFSFVLDEAFRLGLPAIVPDRGALGERIQKAGTRFEPESATDLARVLRMILKDRRVIDTWSREIPELASMAWHGREVAAIYAEVLQDQARKVVQPGPNKALPWRRLEHLAAVNRNYEQMMFGYLGHIKRESGRGDHFETLAKELMERERANSVRLARAEGDTKQIEPLKAIVTALGTEIEAFRSLIATSLEGQPKLRKEAPETPDLEQHVPRLGSLADLVHINQELMVNFHKAQLAAPAKPSAPDSAEQDQAAAQIKELQAELAKFEALDAEAASSQLHLDEALAQIEGDRAVQEQFMRVLGAEIEFLRQLAVADEGHLPQADNRSRDAEGLTLHLEGLGSALDIIAENTRILELVGERHDSRRAVLETLAAEVLRLAAALGEPSDASTSRRDETTPIPAVDVPLIGDLRDTVANNSAVIAGSMEAFERARRQEAVLKNVLDKELTVLRSALLSVGEIPSTPLICPSARGEFDGEIDQKTTELVAENQPALEAYFARLQELQNAESDHAERDHQLEIQLRGRDKVIAELASIVETLRVALTATPAGTAQSSDLVLVDPVVVETDIPGLGSFEQIVDANNTIIEKAQIAVRRQISRCTELETRLAKALAYRQKLEALRGTLSAMQTRRDSKS